MRSTAVALAVFLVLTSPSESSREAKQLAAGLLDLLHMDNTPNISSRRQDIPRYILNLYKQKRSPHPVGRIGNVNPYLSSTVRIVFPQGIDEKANGSHHLRFNLSESRSNGTGEVRNVELHVHMLSRVGGSLKVSILRLRQPGRERTVWNEDEIPIVSREFEEATKSRWMVFNITRSLNSSLKKLELLISSKPGHYIISKGKKKPFLAIFSDQDTDHKSKNERFTAVLRSRNDLNVTGNFGVTDAVHERRKRSQVNVCRHRRLLVRIRDLRWNNWIIAPARFGFHYCEGSCPVALSKDSNPTNHAILQNILHRRVNKKIPSATCVPTELRSTALLYYDADNEIVLKDVPGMVASACGCR